MPTTADDFVVRGMPAALASEVAFQFDNAGSRSVPRLMALGLPQAAASELVRLMAKPSNYLTQGPTNLAALGVPMALASHLITAIQAT
jgi:hypothetical protein